MHTDDLSEAIIKILLSKKHGQIYNAGVQKPITMKEIIIEVSKYLELDFKDFVKIAPGRKLRTINIGLIAQKSKNI